MKAFGKTIHFLPILVFSSLPTAGISAELFITDAERNQDDALSGANVETVSPTCNFVMSGVINGGDTAWIRVLPELGYGSRGILCLDSPGGSFLDVVTYDGYVPPTAVMPGTKCDSACAILFLRGTYIGQDQGSSPHLSSTLWPGGELGFHAPSLDLPPGGTYTDASVQGAFKTSLEASALLFDLSRKTDSDDKLIVNDYLLARILETPPDELYKIETVGDALFSEINVAGVRPLVDDVSEASRSICDNLFFLNEFPYYWRQDWRGDDTLISAVEAVGKMRDLHQPDEYVPDGYRRIVAKETDASGLSWTVIGPYWGMPPSRGSSYCIVKVEGKPADGCIEVLGADAVIWGYREDEVSQLVKDPATAFADVVATDADFKERGLSFPNESLFSVIEKDYWQTFLGQNGVLMLFPFERPLATLPIRPDIRFLPPNSVETVEEVYANVK